MSKPTPAPVFPAQPKALLLAINDPDQSAMFSELLSREGFQIKSVRNGHEALKILTDNGIDLAILDVQLTGCSGVEVLAELSLRGRIPPVKILMVASFAGPADLHRYRQKGAHACLSKPFTYEQLREKIVHLLV